MADLLALATRMGVLPGFHDLTGQWRETSAETAAALLAAMGLAPDDRPETVEATLPIDVICEAGRPPALDMRDTPWQLTHEDGGTFEGQEALPELPLGIHRLHARGIDYTLLAAPPRLPEPARCWGLVAPLYGLSAQGIGSYDDLARLAAGMGGQGAAFLGLNPVHAGFPTRPDLFSPYTPSHRRRLNVIHLAAGAGSPGPLVDYARDIPARMAALRDEYGAFAADPAFDAWQAGQGESLQCFALHQALADRHGAFWSDWPSGLSAPDLPGARSARRELAGEMRFHAWLQWRAETALARAGRAARDAGMRHGLYLDLAVGTHPHGAETWEDRESFAFGASLGAPPDAFGPEGQNWNLAPFNPLRLRASAYAPLAETLRRQLQFAGVLRIDHILGFERAYWVPGGAPGAYVKMPTEAMLAVTRIEAARAGNAVIVGEDLGNIPGGLQAMLSDSGILGCRLAMFERSSWQPPVFRAARDYDRAAIASFSTHDLPTWRGWRQGADIAARAAISGLDGLAARAERAAEIAAMDAILPDDGIDALHDHLARTPSRLVAVQAELLLDMAEQPNLPGTTTEYPNWRLRLPEAAGNIPALPATIRTAAIMRENDRQQEGS
ncbi:4-alpha-glucanotransferase [Paracoccus halophilus]|uniref:4-alpha-glucanotransferase n=1 Tax=Paracoccus halophilus TaxID=376733 RepID=A0A099F0M5_9RHOB|nr:4-alpha-glucanotransferase [Paracoccus halophilus]KGJ03707.1 4-alpha-glucanotransferase [Paracoccus halophilus]SFA57318.1 4-alpha-glucanotransferase [Paracoccus halophilus]